MRRGIVTCLCLFAVAGCGRAEADEKADELARLAGEYTAEFSARTGRQPADKERLKLLTLKIAGDEWAQNFRGDVAPYTIALDLTDDLKAIKLTHKKVQAVRNCTYVLKGETLTVTEELGEDIGIAVTIWKRKPIN